MTVTSLMTNLTSLMLAVQVLLHETGMTDSDVCYVSDLVRDKFDLNNDKFDPIKDITLSLLVTNLTLLMTTLT